MSYLSTCHISGVNAKRDTDFKSRLELLSVPISALLVCACQCCSAEEKSKLSWSNYIDCDNSQIVGV